MKNSARIQRSGLVLLVVASLFILQVSAFAQAQKIKLEEGTQVRLRLMESLNSATAQVGQVVSFEVLDNVEVDGTLVIAEGASAWATVVEADHKKSFGRAGKLAFRLDYVKAVDGTKVPLRATSVNKGEGKGAAAGAIVAASALFFLPAAPLALLVKGKNVDIPRGQHLQAFVDGDRLIGVRQELSKNIAYDYIPGTKRMQVVQAEDRGNVNEPSPTSRYLQPASLNSGQVNPASASPAELGAVNIIADLSGAEIEVDGTAYGNCPAMLRLAPGLHAITVKYPGLPIWERSVNVTPGSSLTFRVILQSAGTTRVVHNQER